jgi:hypothetical protein
MNRHMDANQTDSIKQDVLDKKEPRVNELGDSGICLSDSPLGICKMSATAQGLSKK